MSRSALARPGARRRLAAAALVVALPLTTAAGCQDEGDDGPGMEQDDGDTEDGVEQEDGTDQEDDGEGDD